MTHAAAAARCESHGARLCTMEEMPAVVGTGCFLNREHVWSATSCTTGQGEPGFLTLVARDDLQRCNADAMSTASLRCCADPPIRATTNLALGVADSYEDPYDQTTDVQPTMSGSGAQKLPPSVAALFGGAAVLLLVLASYGLHRARRSQVLKANKLHSIDPAANALPWHNADGTRIELHSVASTPEPSMDYGKGSAVRHSSVTMPVGKAAPPPPPIATPPLYRRGSSYYDRLSVAEQRC